MRVSHPNLQTRRPRDIGDALRAMIYAPDPELAEWIERELASLRVTWQVGRTVEHVIAGLTEDPPPRAQMLIADLDAMTPIDVLVLHTVRQQGWFGVIVAIGEVTPELCTSLGIHWALPRRPEDGKLAALVNAAGINTQTARIEKILF